MWKVLGILALLGTSAQAISTNDLIKAHGQELGICGQIHVPAGEIAQIGSATSLCCSFLSRQDPLRNLTSETLDDRLIDALALESEAKSSLNHRSYRMDQQVPVTGPLISRFFPGQKRAWRSQVERVLRIARAHQALLTFTHTFKKSLVGSLLQGADGGVSGLQVQELWARTDSAPLKTSVLFSTKEIWKEARVPQYLRQEISEHLRLSEFHGCETASPFNRLVQELEFLYPENDHP